MSVDKLVANWKEVRSGFAKEVERLPADQFSFRATPAMRTVAQLVQHVIETQKLATGETCRNDTNLRRRPFPEQLTAYAPGVSEINDKEGLLKELRDSMDAAAEHLRNNADELANEMIGLTGQPMPKMDFLNFIVSHEMYHRGQLTVYERLLNIEPALTKRFRELTATAGS